MSECGPGSWEFRKWTSPSQSLRTSCQAGGVQGCRLSDPGILSRPPQDISLEEFDDEDLSEITDDCGLGLSYDSDHCEKVGKGLGVKNPINGEPHLGSVCLVFI